MDGGPCRTHRCTTYSSNPSRARAICHPRSILALRAARTGHNNDRGGRRLWIGSDRKILKTGAAATAMAAAPQMFAQQSGQGGAARFYEKGRVRIRYEEAGSGFPLLL